MVRTLLLAAALASTTAGCMIRTTRARDATLHYHPTLDELRAPPRATTAAPPRALAARVVFGGIDSAYPQPIGLAYDDDGAARKLIGVEWSAGELEAALARALPAALAGGDGAAVHVRGALVSVALYRVGGTAYARAQLEVRVARDGSEVYAARYTAGARGGDRAQLFAAIATELAAQLARDDRFAAAVPGGAS